MRLLSRIFATSLFWLSPRPAPFSQKSMRSTCFSGTATGIRITSWSRAIQQEQIASALLTSARQLRFEILDEMPADWLAADERNEVAAWWLSAAKSAHITAIREGLSDGTRSAGAFAASVCAWPGVLIMSVNAPITSADCRRKREVIRIVPSNKAARFFQNTAWPLSFPVSHRLPQNCFERP
jgi:hypothetical protein